MSSVLDEQAIAALRSFGDELVAATLADFLDAAPMLVADMEAAAAAGDDAQASRRAHRLKGDGVLVGATGLAAACDVVEHGDMTDAALERVRDEAARAVDAARRLLDN